MKFISYVEKLKYPQRMLQNQSLIFIYLWKAHWLSCISVIIKKVLNEKRLEKDISEEMEKRIQKSIKLVQKKYKVDVLELGGSV